MDRFISFSFLNKISPEYSAFEKKFLSLFFFYIPHHKKGKLSQLHPPIIWLTFSFRLGRILLKPIVFLTPFHAINCPNLVILELFLIFVLDSIVLYHKLPQVSANLSIVIVLFGSLRTHKSSFINQSPRFINSPPNVHPPRSLNFTFMIWLESNRFRT